MCSKISFFALSVLLSGAMLTACLPEAPVHDGVAPSSSGQLPENEEEEDNFGNQVVLRPPDVFQPPDTDEVADDVTGTGTGGATDTGCNIFNPAYPDC